jgi:endonuclease YncB( thermonuclease family)
MKVLWCCCIGESYIEKKDEEPLAFVPPITGGRVIKVYDGDSITIAAKLPYKASPLYRFSIRLSGIDCPEIRSKDPFEAELAIYIRDLVRNLVYEKEVELRNLGKDKYGRVLADVLYLGRSVNEWLIDNSLAVRYSGKTKPKVDWKKLAGSSHAIRVVNPFEV